MSQPAPFTDSRIPTLVFWDHVRGCECPSCCGKWDDGLLGVIALVNPDGDGRYKTYGRSFTREMAIDRLIAWERGEFPLPPEDWLTEQRRWLAEHYPPISEEVS
jgi:hypothetical protein